MPKLRTFLALDATDRVAGLEAIAALAVASLLVRFIPPRRWRRGFGSVASEDGGAELTRDRLITTRRVRLAVARAGRNLPSDSNCLPQALAARWMLGRRGIASALYLGTERDAAGVPRFHAWLKVGPEWVTGQCDESRYSLLVPGGSETV